jgi:DHA1 family bicyclomycin/chloramphenicol resistance-like MFS transporter
MRLPLLLILGALSAFGPLAIDFYLPAFPVMARDFATDVEHVQLSLAAYFVGLALGQLAYGPLADRYGRRWPLLIGVTLFTLGSLACSFAPTLDWLIGARFVQALGGCAGMVITRAVVRDSCEAVQAAKVFSQLMLVMGLAPILAPLAGSLLMNAFGWQAIFVSLTIFSAACGVAVALWLPETLPADAPKLHLSGTFRRYIELFRDGEFIAFAICGGVGMAGMFAYIAGSPFIFIELYGVPAEHYGWLFGTNAAGFILVSQINTRLLRLRGPGFWLRRFVWFYLACSVVLLVIALSKPDALWPLLIPLFIGMASLGSILPNATACAMAKQGKQAGIASALMGSLQFGIAAGASVAVGALHNGTAMPMALVITFCALLAACLAWYTGQHVPAERKAHTSG